MKYRNLETGVILEPHSTVAETALKNDPHYVAVMDNKPSKKPKSITKSEG